MAEAVFKNALLTTNRECIVSSAGINALIDHKADDKALEVMKTRDLDISGHRAAQLTSHMTRKADLILVMESTHKNEIENTEPWAKGKVFRLGEWGGYDINDPYQQDLSVFESTLTIIENGVNDWINKIYR